MYIILLPTAWSQIWLLLSVCGDRSCFLLFSSQPEQHVTQCFHHSLILNCCNPFMTWSDLMAVSGTNVTQPFDKTRTENAAPVDSEVRSENTQWDSAGWQEREDRNTTGINIRVIPWSHSCEFWIITTWIWILLKRVSYQKRLISSVFQLLSLSHTHTHYTGFSFCLRGPAGWGLIKLDTRDDVY